MCIQAVINRPLHLSRDIIKIELRHGSTVPHSKHSVSVIQTSQLMLYREIIMDYVYCAVRVENLTPIEVPLFFNCLIGLANCVDK